MVSPRPNPFPNGYRGVHPSPNEDERRDDSGPSPDEVLRRPCGHSQPRFQHRARRGDRVSRVERRREDHHAQDSRLRPAPHEIRKRIGFLPDVPPLYEEMTVGAYLSFVAQLRGVAASAARERVVIAEEQMALRETDEEVISSLSHGYRQRLGVAQALVHNPALLILDEPNSGLDPAQIVEMRALIRNLRGAHTILISSHILSEISQTCDRLLIIQAGEIVAQGTE